MKFFMILALAASSLGAHAQTAPDPDNSKLRIVLLSDSRPQPRDCKLSLKEINNFDGHSVGRRYLCAQLIEANEEISLTDLKNLIEQRKVSLSYTGANPRSLKALLSEWRDKLILDAAGYTDRLARLSLIQPWSFEIVSSEGGTTSIELSNSVTNESVIFAVTMNAPRT